MLYLKLIFVEDEIVLRYGKNCVLISINVCSIESIQWSVSRLSNALFNIRSKHTNINCQNQKNTYCTNSDWHFLFGWFFFIHLLNGTLISIKRKSRKLWTLFCFSLSHSLLTCTPERKKKKNLFMIHQVWKYKPCFMEISTATTTSPTNKKNENKEDYFV